MKRRKGRWLYSHYYLKITNRSIDSHIIIYKFLLENKLPDSFILWQIYASRNLLFAMNVLFWSRVCKCMTVQNVENQDLRFECWIFIEIFGGWWKFMRAYVNINIKYVEKKLTRAKSKMIDATNKWISH